MRKTSIKKITARRLRAKSPQLPRKKATANSRSSRKAKSLAATLRALVRAPSVTMMSRHAAQMQADGAHFAKKTFEVELGLSRALVTASAWLAMALNLNRSDARLYPPDWIDPDATGNPDYVMGCILCQVANYGHSVLNLVERGLDTPARVLLRSTADLCYMLALLGNDRQALQSYVVDKSVTEKQRWYNLFSGRKLSARLKDIDRELGLPEEWTKFMQEFRTQNGEFFSEATHHSPTAILVGSLPINPKTGLVELGLLGGPNRFGRATLDHLVMVMNYGLTMFLFGVRPFSPQFTAPKFWDCGVQLVREVQPLLLRWLNEGQEPRASNPEAG